MPNFYPFRGLRYDKTRVDPNKVIAPPYDIVSPDQQQILADRSLYNAIHIELPQADPQHNLDPYQSAAKKLRDWHRDTILRQDGNECLYIYKMTYTISNSEDDSKLNTTTGVIGAVEIEYPYTLNPQILPHEKTLTKPKGDRLMLLQACKANTSPIWGLSLDARLTVAIEQALADTYGDKLADVAWRAVDDDGVVHELWAVEDPHSINSIRSSINNAPIVLADGHHRYETALQYAQELGENKQEHEYRHDNHDDNRPPDYQSVMALVVQLEKDQLHVHPIHRLISGLSQDFDITEAFTNFTNSSPVKINTNTGKTRNVEGIWVATGQNESLFDIATHPEDPDSVLLEAFFENLPPHEITYEPDWNSALEQIRAGKVQAGIKVRPTTVEQIAHMAHNRKMMPPKTTYFHPKPRTGMVFRLLQPLV
ncbi:MAG: DUF1015 domain-containing protein [Actinobacteria bacterium]|nr:DUF1015 domain-containing protein [Actinomycetota bacterium]MCL6105403.1 DUF1015 domain-containing protein [Actinomycetota bacterium]